MSQENVEAIRRATDAYNRGDIDGVLEESSGTPRSRCCSVAKRRYIGDTRVSVRSCKTLLRRSPSFRPSNRSSGTSATASSRSVTSGAAARKVVPGPKTAIAWLVEFNNGKAVRLREYLDPNEALEAAGLEE
jgi:hypothetical protein